MSGDSFKIKETETMVEEFDLKLAQIYPVTLLYKLKSKF